jgi:phosphoglycolate phosphatase
VSYDLILWDLDGTITDPKVGITRGVQFALRRHGVEILDEHLDTLTTYIGPPLDVAFTTYHAIDQELVEDVIAAYREYYLETGIYEVELVAGVVELLAELTARGQQMAIATSKPDWQAEKVLTHFGARHHFAFVGGATMDAARRSKHDVIVHTLARLGLDDVAAAELRVVMVGDREHDVLAAKELGFEAIGVRWGYAEDGELEAAGADHIVDTVDELRALLIA